MSATHPWHISGPYNQQLSSHSHPESDSWPNSDARFLRFKKMNKRIHHPQWKLHPRKRQLMHSVSLESWTFSDLLFLLLLLGHFDLSSTDKLQ